jgi:hypothetical protein
MREYRRTAVGGRKRLHLQRSADGRLRSATEEGDIADIWAEQRRIKLAQAIEKDKQKTARGRGWKRLFRSHSKPASTLSHGHEKEVVVTVTLPKLKFKKPAMPQGLSRALADVPKHRLYVGGGLLVFFLLLTFVGPFFYGTHDKGSETKKPTATTTVLDSKGQKPSYETILPEGEVIEDLGGWRRISPPDKEPVFAYADTLTGIPITVSEQPLPASFQKDMAGEITKLAEQFGANEKITAGDLTAYLGTSIKGPQSIILAKRDLLVLIKSESKISNQEWADYIEALR